MGGWAGCGCSVGVLAAVVNGSCCTRLCTWTSTAVLCLLLLNLFLAAQPLSIRRKAVSYVRFCSAAELVSASTDSTLRLWVRLR